MNTALHEKIFADGDEWLAALSHCIKEAQKFILIESYIFNLDHCGNQVISLLKSATARGVRVSILVDGIGSPDWNLNLIKTLSKENIESRIYHPSPFLLTKPRFIQYFNILEFLRILGRLNKRNHRKLVIVDGHTAIIGSINVADCHLKSEFGDRAWHDTAVLVKTSEVEKLVKSFEYTWKCSWHQGINWIPVLPSPMLISDYFLNYDSIRSRLYHYHFLLLRLKNAKRIVYITNAYFVPRTRLLMALKKCAKRGVDVRIMVPSHSDIKIVRWATLSFYEEMINAGIHIFEFGPNMLHAKTMIIDDWSIVGSCNLNNRSFMHDLELNAVLHSDHSKKMLLEIFKKNELTCKAIQKPDIEQRNWFSKILSRMAISIKYWL